MPNPVYTTPMVWDPDINPEGLAEKFNFHAQRQAEPVWQLRAVCLLAVLAERQQWQPRLRQLRRLPVRLAGRGELQVRREKIGQGGGGLLQLLRLQPRQQLYFWDWDQPEQQRIRRPLRLRARRIRNQSRDPAGCGGRTGVCQRHKRSALLRGALGSQLPVRRHRYAAVRGPGVQHRRGPACRAGQLCLCWAARVWPGRSGWRWAPAWA